MNCKICHKPILLNEPVERVTISNSMDKVPKKLRYIVMALNMEMGEQVTVHKRCLNE